MRTHVFADAGAAALAAADRLASWLGEPATRNLMVAGGRTPLPVYAEVGRRGLRLGRLRVFVLDEYVGVPAQDPRTCSNLLRRAVQEAWGVEPERFLGLSSEEEEALAAVTRHEARIAEAGGLDAIVLGLGANGHLGFNEPGSAADSPARLVELEPVSVAANRDWFAGEHAPRLGATVGLRSILSARRLMLLAFGAAKSTAVHAMVRGPRHPSCPASFLQSHSGAHVYLDTAAAAALEGPPPRVPA